MKIYNLFTNAVLVVALTALSAAAQTYRPSNTGTVNGKVTHAGVDSFVRSAGYTIAPGSNQDVYVKLQRGSRTYNVRISLSTDENKIWLCTGLINMSAGQLNSPLYMRRLLEDNFTGPHSFGITKGKLLVMSLAIDNLTMTPDYLRSKVSQFLTLAEDAAPKWEAAQ